MKVWPALGIVLIQTFLLSAHWFVFHTLTTFWTFDPGEKTGVGLVLLLLGFSFVFATMLGFYFSGPGVQFLYLLASLWLGLFNYLFWAACLSWTIDLPLRLASVGWEPAMRPRIATAFFDAAILVSFFGVIYARFIPLRRITIELPNLPDSWRGRTALLASDLHLGNLNRTGFARRIARIASRLNPDLIFIPGDLYDGVKADPARLAAPLLALSPPLGVFYSGGNHEEFGDPKAYFDAAAHGGAHVLSNSRVDVDGVAIIGITYALSTRPLPMRTFLEGLHLDPAKPSILLNHVPNRLPLVEQAGVSLQLSGHTHCGQFLPFTWITRRAFGKFTYGLQRFGKLQVLTSSGAGTWGPPMRIGSSSEVVLITFA